MYRERDMYIYIYINMYIYIYIERERGIMITSICYNHDELTCLICSAATRGAPQRSGRRA